MRGIDSNSRFPIFQAQGFQTMADIPKVVCYCASGPGAGWGHSRFHQQEQFVQPVERNTRHQRKNFWAATLRGAFERVR